MRCVKLILLYLGVVHCRPQYEQPVDSKDADSSSGIEIEQQFIKKINPTESDQKLDSKITTFSHRKIEANTREILEKIAEVNKNQGLLQRKAKPSYFHFPLSYSRSKEDNDESTNFKFSQDPFTNPVFAYLDHEKEKKIIRTNNPSIRSNLNSAEHSDNYIISMVDQNADIDPEDHIPGQYIKRKITHYQGFLMPNSYMLNMYNLDQSNFPSYEQSLSKPTISSPTNLPLNPPNNVYQLPFQQLGYSMYPMQNVGTPELTMEPKESKNHHHLEKETVENIKNIVTATKQNNYRSNYPLNFPTTYFTNFPMGNNLNSQEWNINRQTVPYSNMVDLLTQKSLEKQRENSNKHDLKNSFIAAGLRHPSNARQNWNWPGANLFPIYIRDPFLQMYYAVTNMIEYGPNSGNEGPCKLTPRPQGTRVKLNSNANLHVKNKGHKSNPDINKEMFNNLKELDLKDNDQYLDVEDIDLTGEDLVKFTLNFPKTSASGSREFKDNKIIEKTRSDNYKQLGNNSKPLQMPSGKLDFLSNSFSTEATLENKQLAPIGDQILHVEEIESEPLESEKTDDISISNQGTKKVFSRENTGSGIFIHKLKVRQGGVAIAGPGGIATAGSGGTAIVGPNGIAYTHPDGLAIAGSGTKVIAVDPDVDLNEVIKDSVINGTRHIPNTRVGKVVAVGPVIYYNRG